MQRGLRDFQHEPLKTSSVQNTKSTFNLKKESNNAQNFLSPLILEAERTILPRKNYGVIYPNLPCVNKNRLITEVDLGFDKAEFIKRKVLPCAPGAVKAAKELVDNCHTNIGDSE